MAGVLLTVTTTREPATDLGYLLVKHPDRVHTFELPTSTAHVFFPEATAARCTAALVLDVDPARLGGGRSRQPGPEDFGLGRFVNDRPYVASSLLSAAIARVFGSALRGDSKDRPELARTPIPLELRIPVLRCRGGAIIATRLFEPLDWTVTAAPIPLDETRPEWGDSRYVALTLTGTARLADALNQVYVLLPVLDDAKHYWVSPDEVDKLLRAGEGWLATHPERDLIARRYLAHRPGYASDALERLAAVDDQPDPDSVDAEPPDAEEEAELPAERRIPLAIQRRDAVLAALAGIEGVSRVVDLGCGPGALLAELSKDKRYTEIVGVDVSSRALAQAERRLKLDRVPERQRGRLTLRQSALTYTDDRLVGFDAAVLMEVVEHIDPPRLPAVAATVFGHARPEVVLVTTPYAEYNTRYEGLAPGALRHHDHRFEWTRAEFAAWSAEVGQLYGYRVELRGVGDTDPELGTPTQLAIFRRGSA